MTCRSDLFAGALSCVLLFYASSASSEHAKHRPVPLHFTELHTKQPIHKSVIASLDGRDPLHRHVEGGWSLDGELSQALLDSIFDSHSLGHDGAVIIENGRLARFGCHLPLSKDVRRAELGTRHTAALGVSERTDALCV